MPREPTVPAMQILVDTTIWGKATTRGVVGAMALWQPGLNLARGLVIYSFLSFPRKNWAEGTNSYS